MGESAGDNSKYVITIIDSSIYPISEKRAIVSLAVPHSVTIPRQGKRCMSTGLHCILSCIGAI